jgi:hypothetical protein
VATPTETHPYDHERRGQALDGGRLLAGLGALVLLVSLFLDWYGPPDNGLGGSPGDGITAWTAFELVDILLAALALATIAWAIEGVVRPGRSLVAPGVASAAGPVALTLVVISIVNEPPLLATFGAELDAGVWVALGGALVMTVGGLLRFARISISVTPRERAAPGSADPDTETRPLTEDPRRHRP